MGYADDGVAYFRDQKVMCPVMVISTTPKANQPLLKSLIAAAIDFVTRARTMDNARTLDAIDAEVFARTDTVARVLVGKNSMVSFWMMLKVRCFPEA